MENKEFIFKDWIFDGIESESEHSLVCRARREQFGETLYAIIKETRVPCADPAKRDELRQAVDARMRNLCALGNTSTLLVPDEYAITDEADGFTVHARMEQCTRLAVYAAAHPLSQQELVTMGIDLCTALDALDKRSLRHGDIRPEHIFISKKGGFKLGGFDPLPPAAPLGIPELSDAAYMAPEVYQGAAPSIRAELYALGMVIYRTLNGGRMPFTPPAPAAVTPRDRIDATARRMAGETLPPPASGGDALYEILLKACAADPSARFASAVAMRDALQRWLRTGGVGGAAVMGASGAAGAAAGAGAAAAVMDAPAKTAPKTSAKAAPAAHEKPRKSRTGLFVVIAAAVLLIGAVALAAALDILPGFGSAQTSASTTEATTTTAATTTTPATTTTEATTTTTPATTTTEATTEATTTEAPHEDFLDVLATVSTSLDPGQKDRTTNVQLACDFVNGTVLQPGEEFSYNKVVGERTYERGFRDAKIYTAGEIVDGLGGGICQVSSTLYMAAIRSDLEITERRNHRYTVAYTPLGEDATVVYGSTDFRFVNNTEYPIRIDCVREGSECIVTICGTQTVENKRVEIVTNVLSKDPYQTVDIVDETLAPGERVAKNTSGHSGYKTETYRVVYIDDKEVSRTLENKSTYTRLDKSYRVGPAQTTAATTTTASTDASTSTGGDSQPPEWLGTTDASSSTGVTDTGIPADTSAVTTPDTSVPVTTPDTSASSSSDGSAPPEWLS